MASLKQGGGAVGEAAARVPGAVHAERKRSAMHYSLGDPQTMHCLPKPIRAATFDIGRRNN